MDDPELAIDTELSPDKSEARSKTRRPFGKIQTDLETSDLASKGVHKMLVGEIARLSDEISRLQEIESRFHESDKRCAVLEEGRKQNRMLEILYTVSIAVGAALIGWLPNSTTLRGSIVVTVCAVLLFVFALFAKWKNQ
jgi:hypothetical protein